MAGWDERTFSRFVYLSDVRISGDGLLVAYVMSRADMEADKYRSTVVVESLRDGSRRFIEDASMPRFSPSGSKISVARPVEGKDKGGVELWVYDLRSMSGRRLAGFREMADAEWGPDDRRLLVVTGERLEDDHLYFDSEAPVWFDSRGILSGEKTLIKILDAESGESLDTITINHYLLPYFKVAVWHGDAVAYNAPRRENPYKLLDIHLWRDGGDEVLFENVSFRAVDSDGGSLLLLGKPRKDKISEHNYLYLWRGGGEAEPLTEKYGYNNHGGRLDSKGRVYFTMAREGRVSLYKLSDEGLEELVTDDSWVTGFDVSMEGKVALLKGSDTRLEELYIWDNGLRQLTDYNGPILKKLGVRPAKHFQYTSGDLRIDGWYIEPSLREGEKAPVVVFVHGGPKGMYGYYFKYEAQLLADRGYYAVYFNPRGSDGYSEDFALRVVGRTGLEDFQDIVRGVEEFLRREPKADGGRVGITGISYGGFMTNWALTQTDLFKAGVSENGISYWLTSYAFSDIGLWFDKEMIGEKPLENENYRKLSPLTHAHRVKAPLLLIHSMEDYRCPPDQSIMLHHALRSMGKESYIAVFRKGPHAHSIKGTPKHRAKRYRLIAEFFDRKLKAYQPGFNVKEILEQVK